MTEYIENLDELKEAGKLAEMLCFRPAKYKGKTVTIRLKLNQKWSGWKLKDSVVTKLGLEVGNTICTSVTPQFTEGLSNDVDDMALFVSSDGIDWIIKNKVTAGSIIDCQVQFWYDVVASTDNGNIHAVNLIFKNGLKVVYATQNEKITSGRISLDDIIADLDTI